MPQIRKYFAMIKAAYHHWPEAHEFQPETVTHLRKWLQIKADYAEFDDIAVPFAADQPGLTLLVGASIEAALRAAGGYAFVRPSARGGAVRIYKSQSIAFAKLAHSEACDLFDRVCAVIECEMQISVDVLLSQTQSAPE